QNGGALRENRVGSPPICSSHRAVAALQADHLRGPHPERRWLDRRPPQLPV
ncbi:hypothetical protein T484DRAFT_1906302, partial [Baffinella frigidus]